VLIDFAAARSISLPGIPPGFELGSAGGGHPFGPAERGEVQVRLGQAAAPLASAFWLYRRHRQILDPPGAGQLGDVGRDPVEHRGGSGEVDGNDRVSGQSSLGRRLTAGGYPPASSCTSQLAT
jgi:hypothetical protein